VYGIQLMEELSRHGYSVSPGTLYPTLHQLAAAGYLVQESCSVEGRVRKYYRLTPRGREALAASRARVRELVAELFPGHLKEPAQKGTALVPPSSDGAQPDLEEQGSGPGNADQEGETV
jgi:DNA-binding PadR family transcriptional regulator